jgi:hypothetical protein
VRFQSRVATASDFRRAGELSCLNIPQPLTARLPSKCRAGRPPVTLDFASVRAVVTLVRPGRWRRRKPHLDPGGIWRSSLVSLSRCRSRWPLTSAHLRPVERPTRGDIERAIAEPHGGSSAQCAEGQDVRAGATRRAWCLRSISGAHRPPRSATEGAVRGRGGGLAGRLRAGDGRWRPSLGRWVAAERALRRRR